MMNIAASVKDLSVSQSSFYMIKEFNRCLSNTDLSMSVFFERPAIPPIQTCFACKSVSFLSSYQGVVIATSLEAADQALKASNSSSRYLYLWDLEWLETPMYFDTAMRILRDERLKIIARSNSHAQLIEEFCNRKPIGIVSDWDMREIQKLIGDRHEKHR